MTTFKQRALDTNKALQANLAAGGERERRARHALNLADVVNFWNQAGSDVAFKRELDRYTSYCERIGFDPMEDFPCADQCPVCGADLKREGYPIGHQNTETGDECSFRED